jgi:glycosyltransferase involved in cell wall biosynthesis
MIRVPIISIGIPIYYGEIYLEETLKNILEQSFQDFEIILTDNCAGGIPEEVAAKYSEKYDNIRYVKHEINKGALANWNSIIDYARGKYFIYAGGHDLWSNNLLQDLLDILEKRTDAVLAYAPSYWMEDKLEHSYMSTGYFDTSGSSFIQRFNSVFWGPEEALYGLIRKEAILKTRLQAQIIGSGAVWLSELSFCGEFIVGTTCARYRRKNRDSENRHERLKRYHFTLFNKKKKYWMPYWRFYFYYLTVPFFGKTDFMNRIRVFFTVFFGFVVRYGVDMLLDIGSVFRKLYKKY